MFRQSSTVYTGNGGANGGGFMGGLGAPGQRFTGQQNPRGEQGDALRWHGVRLFNLVAVIIGVFVTALLSGPTIFGLALLVCLARAAFAWYTGERHRAGQEYDISRLIRLLLVVWLVIVGLGVFWLIIGADAAMPALWPSFWGWYFHDLPDGIRVFVLALIAVVIRISPDLDYRARNEVTDPPWPGPVGVRDASQGPLGPGFPYPEFVDDEPEQAPIIEIVPRPVPIHARNGHTSNGAQMLPPSAVDDSPVVVVGRIGEIDNRRAMAPDGSLVYVRDLSSFSRRRDTAGTGYRAWKGAGWSEGYWRAVVATLEAMGALEAGQPGKSAEFVASHTDTLAAIYRMVQQADEPATQPTPPGSGAVASYLAPASDRQTADGQTDSSAPQAESEAGDA